jgi:hypothetical protein
VPVEDRLRGDEERTPPITRNQLGYKDDQRSIGPGEARSLDLASDSRELMAKNEDLRVFREAVHPMDPEELEGAPNEAIEEG